MEKVCRAAALMFFLVLGTVGILIFVLPHRAFSDIENRALSQFPELTWEKLVSGEWQTEFENFVSDQFVGRDLLCGLSSSAKLLAGARDISGVYICSDGYLCEMIADGDIDEDKLSENLSSVAGFAEKYSELNTSVILVPPAEYALKDKLPPFAPEYDVDGLFELIHAQLDGKLSVIDLRESFAGHSEEGLFYKTDHHWTFRGANLAYSQYCSVTGIQEFAFEHRMVTDDFLGTLYSKTLNPLQESDEIWAPVISGELVTTGAIGHVYDESAKDRKDKYTYFFGGNEGLITVENRESAGAGTLLLIKDSFANSFVPYLTENYDKIVMVDLRYFSGRISQLVEDEDVSDILFLYGTESFAQANHFNRLAL